MYNEDSFSCETEDSFKVPNPVYVFYQQLINCLSKTDEDIEEMMNKLKSKIEEYSLMQREEMMAGKYCQIRRSSNPS